MMTQCDDTDGKKPYPFLFALLSEEQEERKRAHQNKNNNKKQMTVTIRQWLVTRRKPKSLLWS